jgi:hypothetical protein
METEMKPAYATISHDAGRFGWTGYAEPTGQPGCFSTGNSEGYSAEQSFHDLSSALPLIRFDAADLDSVWAVIRMHDNWRIENVDPQYHHAKPVTLDDFLTMVRAAGVPVETIGEYMARKAGRK